VTLTERPLLPLDAGEQYRFTFSMEACVGCHSCEVACAEQNGNPVGVNWRRVGEFEGGAFPSARRFNLSMACNHCLDPACLSGCPTNAYVKLDNGIVKHNADDCIGCQYCIWNCPYEVPAFNPQRGVVTKCDMCLPRLEAGHLPACVESCPTGAIKVERVNVAAWRADPAGADAPGLPPAAITLSTTRIELPASVPVASLVASDQRVRPAHPHWPLIALTLLTQLALGSVIASVIAELAGAASRAGAVVAAATGTLALGASLFHLGRPIQAWRALRNLRTSWLSREVALFGVFSLLTLGYAGAWLAGEPALGIGLVAMAVGGAGVYASGRLYLVPARPVWNSPRTLVAFFATAAATGPLVVALAVADGRPFLLLLGGAGSIAQLLAYRSLIERVATRGEREYRGTARLLFERFRVLFFGRVALACLSCALIAVALAAPSAVVLVAALTSALVGELIGRYLFYVTVTPMASAGSFFRA
jgi:DMSO reductase iron-sulfur subunit